MSSRKNNQGMTLIELIISMAIMAIVFSMIALLINTATQSFKRTNRNVNLQLEAQVAMNQLSNLVMEATQINIDTPTGDIKYLIQTSESEFYAVDYIATENKLFLVQSDSEAGAASVNPMLSEDTQYQYLLAQYVDSIKIDVSADKKTAVIEMKFVLDGDSYMTSKKVTLRNSIKG